MNYKRYLKQFGVGVGASWIGMLVSALSNGLVSTPLGYATPSVKNIFKNSIAGGVGTVGMLKILEVSEVNVDEVFPK